MRKTSLAIDEEAAARASRELGTKTLTDTVNRSMREIAARAARRRFIERLSTMQGLELNNPEVLSQAWR